MSALKFDHVAIPIGDPSASYDFYAGTLGLPLVDAFSGKDWGGRDWLMMIFGLSDNRQLALISLRGLTPKRQRGVPRDAIHYAFAVEGEKALNSWRAKIEAAKVDFWEEDHGDQHSVYFEDPNGIILEITTPPSAPEQSFQRDPKALIKRWLKARAAV